MGKMTRWVFVVFCCITLAAGCASRRLPVGSAPESSRPVSRPSQKPYSVDGKRYEPLETHEGFVQQGVASWYGRDFHGKRTSNGERYDMNAMSAAHKTLPLGVYVRVKNIDNGREAVVRINDRGPFVKGRVIDLSFAAARKLGFDDVGTAPVRIEALGYRGSGADQYQPVDSYDAGNYTVQIGAFIEYSNAERLSAKVKKIYGFSDIRTTVLNGETFYRVYVGKYSSLRAAEKAEREFSEHGYPGSFTVALE